VGHRGSGWSTEQGRASGAELCGAEARAVTVGKKVLTCGAAASARRRRGRGRRTSGAAGVRDRAVGEDALRELQLPAGPVRERGEGRPSGPTGKERERERVGRPTGLWAGFQVHYFSYFHSFFFSFSKPHNLFEFKFKFEFNPNTQPK